MRIGNSKRWSKQPATRLGGCFVEIEMWLWHPLISIIDHRPLQHALMIALILISSLYNNCSTYTCSSFIVTVSSSINQECILWTALTPRRCSDYVLYCFRAMVVAACSRFRGRRRLRGCIKYRTGSEQSLCHKEWRDVLLVSVVSELPPSPWWANCYRSILYCIGILPLPSLRLSIQ